ncbi:MAG: helix-turn-helix transcriptional regulator [Acidimicrobiia bacterium]
MTNGWTITIETAGDPVADLGALSAHAEELAELLESMSASVAYSPAGDRYSVTLSIESVSPEAHESTAHAAPTWAESAAATLEALLVLDKVRDVVGLPDWPIVNVHTRTFDEHDAELAQPAYPELVGVAEIAELISVTRQRVSEMRGRPGFPEPIAELRSGPVWTRASVDRFVEEWPRKPGRPRVTVASAGVAAGAGEALDAAVETSRAMLRFQNSVDIDAFLAATRITRGTAVLIGSCMEAAILNPIHSDAMDIELVNQTLYNTFHTFAEVNVSGQKSSRHEAAPA